MLKRNTHSEVSQHTSDDLADRQVADLRKLLKLMAGTNAREALGSLRAGLVVPAGGPSRELSAVLRVP